MTRARRGRVRHQIGSVAGVTALTVLRRLVAPVYLPMVIASIGTGMLIPVLPLALDAAGSSLTTTSLVLAAAGLGAVLGGLPAGRLIARIGERRVMFGSLTMLAVTSVLLAPTDVAAVLIALRLGAGAANIGLRLSRQTYVTRRVEPLQRGRAMSSIGGAFRIGLLIGPIVGGVLADSIGFTATFVAIGAVMAASMIPPALRPADPPLTDHTTRAERAERAVRERSTGEGSTGERTPAARGSLLRDHGRLLLLAGIVPMLTMTVRDGRFVVLPLIGDELGLRPSVVGAVISVGTAADLLLFPAAGWIMDRFGRLAALLPFYGLFAVGLGLLSVADSTTDVVVAGSIIGIGNGLGSGALLTLGSDLAPPGQPGPFLAAFAVMQDTGKVLGPILVGVIGEQAGLDTAAAALAGLTVATAVWLVVVVGETSDGGGRLVRRVD